MKATGIVRSVDHLGRIVIPKELRKTFDIGPLDSLEIFVDGERIILRKYAPGCTFCGNTEKVIPYKEKLICSGCRQDITKGGAH